MAAYISVPRDLTRIKTKIIFNLTKRQLICFSIAAAIGIPVYFLLKKTGNNSLAALGMIAAMMPLFFLAMYERDGQPLEVILRQIMEAAFIRPKIRPYQTDNYYDALMRQYEAEKEVREIVSKAERKRGGHQASRKSHKAGEKGSKKGRPEGKEDRRRTKDRTAIDSVPAHVSRRDLPRER